MPSSAAIKSLLKDLGLAGAGAGVGYAENKLVYDPLARSITGESDAKSTPIGSHGAPILGALTALMARRQGVGSALQGYIPKLTALTAAEAGGQGVKAFIKDAPARAEAARLNVDAAGKAKDTAQAQLDTAKLDQASRGQWSLKDKLLAGALGLGAGGLGLYAFNSLRSKKKPKTTENQVMKGDPSTPRRQKLRIEVPAASLPPEFFQSLVDADDREKALTTLQTKSASFEFEADRDVVLAGLKSDIDSLFAKRAEEVAPYQIGDGPMTDAQAATRLAELRGKAPPPPLATVKYPGAATPNLPDFAARFRQETAGMSQAPTPPVPGQISRGAAFGEAGTKNLPNMAYSGNAASTARPAPQAPAQATPTPQASSPQAAPSAAMWTNPFTGKQVPMSQVSGWKNNGNGTVTTRSSGQLSTSSPNLPASGGTVSFAGRDGGMKTINNVNSMTDTQNRSVVGQLSAGRTAPQISLPRATSGTQNAPYGKARIGAGESVSNEGGRLTYSGTTPFDQRTTMLPNGKTVTGIGSGGYNAANSSAAVAPRPATPAPAPVSSTRIGGGPRGK